MSPPKQLIPGFTRLSFNTYLSQPEKTIRHTDALKSSSPDVILLHTWLNALPRHIAKYTLVYRALYPTSTILLTTTSWHDWAYRSRAAQDAALTPVVEYILSLPETAKILLHIFSNGGAWTATQVALKYKLKTAKPLPISKMIFDSSPGIGGYRRTTTAFAISLPGWRQNPIHRFIGLVSIHVGFAISFMIGAILLRKENPAIILRRHLNDNTLFDGAAARLYIFGDKDIMVPPEEVVAHAVWAKAAGWKVSQERYAESGHVTHAAVDGKRYWAAVERLWEDSSDTNNGV